jgi:putative chitinase
MALLFKYQLIYVYMKIILYILLKRLYTYYVKRILVMSFIQRLFEIFDNKLYLIKETMLRKAPDADSPAVLKLIEGQEVEKIGGGDADHWTVVSVTRNGEHQLGFVESKKLTTFKPEPRIIAIETPLIDASTLQKIAPKAKPELLKAIIRGANSLFPKYGIVNEKNIALFLSQIAIESNYFSTLEENLNYRAERLREVFPTRFTTLESAAYAGNPQKIANRAYANKIGNGDEQSGDGWKYRGRGFIQLTGRANYRDIGRVMGVELERNPDFLLTPAIALEAACCFYQVRGCVKHSDVKSVTKLINPALMNLKERVAVFDMLYYNITHDTNA